MKRMMKKLIKKIEFKSDKRNVMNKIREEERLKIKEREKYFSEELEKGFLIKW
jgi:hypothetical protein